MFNTRYRSMSVDIGSQQYDHKLSGCLPSIESFIRNYKQNSIQIFWIQKEINCD